jgi:hypothetical protein
MGFLLAGALGVASAAWAHHSFAQFDADQKVIVDGRVVTWSYTNPHSWLFVEGLDEKGEMQKWSFEGAAPIHAARQGVTGNTFKVGERVRVVMSPLRDGRRAGAMCFVVKEDASIAQPNDSVCNANEVIARWKAKGWLENGKHLDAHPTTE